MNAILETRGLTKTYKTFELKDINISLPYGSIMGFIGENGAGKSTTIKAILDVVQKDAGTITLFGQQPANSRELAELKQRIGVVYDECCFSGILKVGDVSTFMKHIYRNWSCDVYSEWLRRFKLDPAQKISELSRGMRMKTSLAAALSHGAELLILDEPTGGLDPIVRDEILDVFLEFVQDENHAIFVSSHITSDLEKIADYITFIHNGRIVMSDEKDAMLERYGMLKCEENMLRELDRSAVAGIRRNRFGVEALVERSAVPSGFELEKVTLEDIMLYTIKGEEF